MEAIATVVARLGRGCGSWFDAQATAIRFRRIAERNPRLSLSSDGCGGEARWIASMAKWFVATPAEPQKLGTVPRVSQCHQLKT
jgi:hypothetical protein